MSSLEATVRGSQRHLEVGSLCICVGAVLGFLGLP